MSKLNLCGICNIKATIYCDKCDDPTFYCSKPHLNMHNSKVHDIYNKEEKKSKSKDKKDKLSSVNLPTFQSKPIKENSTSINNLLNNNNSTTGKQVNQINHQNLVKEEKDLRKLFEHIHNLRKTIDEKFNIGDYTEAIILINKSLPIAKKFYQEDHIFIIDLVFVLCECYCNSGNLEESIYNLEQLLEMTNNTKHQLSTANYRFKCFMLIGATSINIGDYSRAIKNYELAEKEVSLVYSEPELNLKQCSVFLNIGICYIYLGNFNIAEKVLRKGQKLIEGLLGNDIVHRINSDFNENLGLCNESTGKFKEAVNYYKKALKTKYSLYGDKHDEVLDLQYKISTSYVSMKMFTDAEQVMISICDIVKKEKLSSEIDSNYRYGTYFYLCGVIFLKLLKKDKAKEMLLKSESLWKDILSPNDPSISSLNSFIKMCEKKTSNN